MITVLSFVLAIGLLVAIHEYGHYRVAVACGVKVLRFSVGFGRPLVKWRISGSDTEFVIAAIPLGGYVRMLDEREAPVDSGQKHQAFNTQSLAKRAAIVGAGPAANLLLAVVLFCTAGWLGQNEAAPVLGAPVAGSIAERAGLLARDEVVAMQVADGEFEPVASFEQLNWSLMQVALNGQTAVLRVIRAGRSGDRDISLAMDKVDARVVDAKLMRAVGVMSPFSPPVVGDIAPASAALAAGLLAGDLALTIDGVAVVDAQQLRDLIRRSPEQRMRWTVRRAGADVELDVTPARVPDPSPQAGTPGSFGRIGAVVGARPAMVFVRQGFFDGVARSVARTWDLSVISVQMLWRMLTGQASLKNLSGPITMADYAGKSAQIGLTAFLVFLATVSVSLGVLNLLPLPVLDGGHLMYYLWEALTGRSVSELWQDRLQRGGVAVLLMMMSVAWFNDLARLFGWGA